MAEFEVIEKYFLGATMPDQVKLGPGDDCAVLSVPAGSELCVSTDTLLSGVHFPIDAEPELIATRSIAANLSDLAAMGAEPHGMTMALTLPKLENNWLGRFSSTCHKLAEKYQCPIVGGNLAQGPLSVTFTVMGVVPCNQALKRSGAESGDLIFVSGELGGAAGAVDQLSETAPCPELFQYYAEPAPRLELGSKLRGLASAAIDISDGLTSDLKHLLAASEKGAQIETSQVPLAPALGRSFSESQALSFALNGGDEYELCFTVKSNQLGEVASLSKALGLALTRIGCVTDQAGELCDPSGQSLTASGYEHFKEGT